MRKRHVAAGCAVVLVGGFFVTGPIAVLHGALELLFGWWAFLGDAGGRVSVNGSAVALFFVAVVAFAVGLHALVRSFGVARWRASSTAAVSGLVFVAFAAGISGVAIVHQVAWLATAPEPLVDVRGAHWVDAMLRVRTQRLFRHAEEKGIRSALALVHSDEKLESDEVHFFEGGPDRPRALVLVSRDPWRARREGIAVHDGKYIQIYRDRSLAAVVRSVRAGP